MNAHVESGFLVRRSAWREGGSRTLCLFALMGAVAVAQQPAAPGTLTVSGVVTTANDEPLPRVRVGIPAALSPIQVSSGVRVMPERSVLTDNLGRFTIRVPASSSIRLEFLKARYITQVADIPLREPGAPGAGLRVRMSLAGAISGQVVDRLGGGPVVSTTVMLWRDGSGRSDGPLATTRTNDLGEYRFGGLAPGRYVASVLSAVNTLRGDFPNRETIVNAGGVQGPPVDVPAGTDVAGIVLTIDAPSEAEAGAGNRPDPGPDKTASVSGRVVGADGRPIPRAIVHAYRPYIAGQQVETDRSGRYQIDRLVPGDYTIAVRKYGFESRQYGQEIGAAAGRSITLKDGQSVNALDVTLLRPGAISGTIFDEFGEPVQDVMVGAVRLRPNPGGRGTSATSGISARTDDRGQYRLSGLPPGAYFVQAVVGDELTAGTGYLPRLYPGVMAFEQATQTRVDFGSDIRGIDFAVTPAEAYRITGTVFDANGSPARASVTLAVSERSGAVQTQARSMNVSPDGSFEFTNVGPGDYVVQASAASRVPMTSGRPTTTAIQFAMSYVTITGSEPPPVDLRLTHGATLIGRVRYEGQPAGPSPLLTIETLAADRDRASALFSRSQSADVQPDGSFEIMSVFGPTLIHAQPQRSDWYVKSVLFQGQDLVDTPFDFGVSRTVRDIEVVISTTGATVTGRVTDDRGAAVRDYAVLVFPTFRDQWFPGSRWVKSVRARSVSGPFVITGLPPGDYLVAAIDPPDIGTPIAGSGTQRTPIADPALLESVSLRATRITLGEGQTQDVTLRVIRP